MDIVFGWFLDGAAYPETVTDNQASFNSAICGPARFLNILETALGLGGPQSGRSVRTGEYLSKLQLCDDGNFFFSRSLEIDPWATAQELLNMRDELIEGGWRLSPIPGNRKINALISVEMAGDISLGSSERLILVNRELSRKKRTPIKTLRICGDSKQLPALWQETISLLRGLGTKLLELPAEPIIARRSPSDLDKIRNAYVCERSSEHLSCDGSIVILDSDDEIQASEFTAALLASCEKLEDVAIIRGAGASMLDECCFRFGLPRIGNETESPHRSLLQVLPLALELIWQPFDAARCLEFLSIEGGPLPGSLSWYLRDAVRREPGLGGPLWNSAWHKIAEKRRDQLTEQNKVSKDKLDDRVEADIEQWKQWFSSVSRRDDAIKAAHAESVCKRVEEWATRKGAIEKKHSFYEIARNHAATLRQILSNYSTRMMTLHQLRSMVESVVCEGAISNFAESQAAPWTVVDHPGQIWRQSKTILWWNFLNDAAAPVARNRWTDIEMAVLSRSGVTIDSPSNKAKREADAWRSAILNCSDKLILIKPRAVNGKTVSPHPAWDELSATVGGVSGLLPCVVKASDLYSINSQSTGGLNIVCNELEQKRLPGKLNGWQLPAGLIFRRETESFTSIERLLGCSLAWTLEYPGKLRGGMKWSIADGEKLTGELAHKAIAKLLTESKEWTPINAAERALKIVDDLMPKVASPLLLPGAVSQVRKARESIRRSVMFLIRLINEGGLRIVEPEFPVKSKFLEKELAGTIDLLLESKDKQKIVIDLKWSQYPRSYKGKIQDGKALQLAAYTWLISEQEKTNQGNFAGGFFLLRQALLYFNTEGVFPKYTLIHSNKTLENTWNTATSDYDRTMQDLSSGKAIATGIPSAPDAPKIDSVVEPPCGFCKFNTFCGMRNLE